MRAPYRSAPGPAREEFISFVVQDPTSYPNEHQDGMARLHHEINTRLGQGWHVEHMTQSSLGTGTLISLVFEAPADVTTDRRHRP